MKNYSELKNADIELDSDGDCYDIYINGWYVAEVKKEDLSPQIIELFKLEEQS